ncbi:MAG: geranylgeranyl reductase family protein [Deltaproteobacteria bacterium]|nr:geranylgeranyl reductase family protein [Deltaproteobacteria bacterium]
MPIDISRLDLGGAAEIPDEPDYLVIGAGPAGSSAAARLAQAGKTVYLADYARFPREKVCGDGLSPNAVSSLMEIGIGPEQFEGHYTPITHVRLVAPSGRGFVAAYPENGRAKVRSGYVVPRRELDALILAHAVRSGARFRTGVRLRKAEWENGQPVLTVDDNGTIRRLTPRNLIAADGEFSLIRRGLVQKSREVQSLAIRAYYEGCTAPAHMEIHFPAELKPGYGWIFPETDGRLNVGVYVYQHTLDKGLDIHEAFRFFTGQYEPALRYLKGGRICGNPRGYPITFYEPSREPGCRRVLLAGDAAGVADNLTGEGIFQAIRTGIDAAGALLHSPETAVDAYQAKLAGQFSEARTRGRFIGWVLEHFAWFINFLFRRCEANSYVKDRVFRVVNADAPLWHFFTPSLWLHIFAGGSDRKLPDTGTGAGKPRSLTSCKP